MGTQAAEVDSVGVHAFAAGNVRTRDPDVHPTKSLPEKEVEASGVDPLRWVETLRDCFGSQVRP